MLGIFICYRREDSGAYAGRLYDHLVARFGEHRVFMDIDTVDPGDDFVQVIEEKVSSCDVLVAVIGKQWLSAKDRSGRRRLDDPDDFVRVEIESALRRGVRVIPALVDGAEMPRSEDLPADLASLARRNALEVTLVGFRQGVSRLIDVIERTISAAAPAGRSDAPKAARPGDPGEPKQSGSERAVVGTQEAAIGGLVREPVRAQSPAVLEFGKEQRARNGPPQADLAPKQAEGRSLTVQGSEEDQEKSEPSWFQSRIRAAVQGVHRWRSSLGTSPIASTRHRSADRPRSVWRRAVVGTVGTVILLFLSAVFVAHYPFGGSLAAEARADRIVIEKGARRLRLMASDQVLKSYWIALGHNDGPKTTLGDGRTPEGRYTIDRRNANSQYHLALHVSYPNEADRQRAAALREPSGDIAIHGMLDRDWWVGRLDPVFWVGTGGDIVVMNGEIDEISRAVPDGTPIEIRP